jgi:hypothetical protein
MPMLARAARLREEAGISYGAIAAVLALDYEQAVDKNTLRRNLRLRGTPADLRRVTDTNRNNLRHSVGGA